MSTQRVDKSWKTKGLGGFDSAAIFGTLAHYGVTVDEPAFKQLAQDKFPMEIAGEWKLKWKGTGPFQPFPYAAADELIRRYFPDRLTPMQLAQLVGDTLQQAALLLEKRPADMGKAFDAFDAKKASLPPPGERRHLFNAEMVGFFDNVVEAFDGLAVTLAKRGFANEAKRAAQMQGDVFPDRAGSATAVVSGILGERDGAVKDLLAMSTDDKRDVFARYHAFSGLMQLEAWKEVESMGLKLFDDCAAQSKWPLADNIAHQLAQMVDRQTPGGLTNFTAAQSPFAAGVLERFQLAHQHVGSHHHGH